MDSSPENVSKDPKGGAEQQQDGNCRTDKLVIDNTLTLRMSLRELDDHPKKKNDFLKAWKLIKALPSSNPNSFWSIATFHGMPFKERNVPPFDLKDQWPSYCQHGNVLFPTWHRFYCLRLEQALQTVLPDGDVALHYWDETSEASLEFGIPPIVLDHEVWIDGNCEPNPLRNFTIPEPIDGGADSYYVKKVGYTTTRYPLSGITNPTAAHALAIAHNCQIAGMNESPEELLQLNVNHWLNIGRTPGVDRNSVYDEFVECLKTTEYNHFSNNMSAKTVNEASGTLEQPHDDVHLMVGGYTMPTFNKDGSVAVDEDGNIIYQYFGLIEGANGDMGANEVAAFDPIFFLHHSNIDRMFWTWQKKWGHTTDLTITADPCDKGTSTISQGPTPNQSPISVLTMDTILYPFQNQLGVPRTSKDCINVEDLGYTYSIGSLDAERWPVPSYKKEHIVADKVTTWKEIEDKLSAAVKEKLIDVPVRASFDITDLLEPETPSLMPIFIAGSGPTTDISYASANWKLNNFIKVSNLDRDGIAGSFVVQAFYRKDGKLYFIGQRGVLDRWERENCANCQTHREAAVRFRVNESVQSSVDLKNLVINVVRKDPNTGKMVVTNIEDPTARSFIYDTDRPAVSFIKRFEQDLAV